MRGSWFRKLVLALAGNRRIRAFVGKYGMKLGAGRFVAAETLEETVGKVRELNGKGFAATLDYLGETVRSRGLADQSAGMILRTLDEIHRHRLDAHLSVKLTQLGLLIDENLCLALMERIVEKAKGYGNFVRIDMEDSSVTEATLRIFRALLEKYGREHVGIVIQSYLYRSVRDLERLGPWKINVRVVKGAYREPAEVAYPDKKDVDRQYLRLVRNQLHSGGYAAIATHDRKIIRQLLRELRADRVPLSRFEFQMLYGIAVDLQAELLREGYRVRIYTPFGKEWYAYFSRRIAERPANLLFALKGIIPGWKAVRVHDD